MIKISTKTPLSACVFTVTAILLSTQIVVAQAPLTPFKFKIQSAKFKIEEVSQYSHIYI